MMRTCKTSWGPTGGSVALPPRAARSHNQHRVVVRAAAEDTKTVAELIEEQGIDMTISGLRHLPEETQHSPSNAVYTARGSSRVATIREGLRASPNDAGLGFNEPRKPSTWGRRGVAFDEL